MKTKKAIFAIIVILLTLLCIAFFLIYGAVRKSGHSGNINDLEVKSTEIYVGDTPISDYVIVGGGFSRESSDLLQEYIYHATGKKLKIRAFKGIGAHTISLRINKNLKDTDKKVLIDDGNITIRAAKPSELDESVEVFANAFLGYAFAGEERERFLQNETGCIYIPETIFDAEGGAWIEEREPIICLWKTTTARGVYYKEDTCLNSEIMSYSDDDLYSYVKGMYDLGYTGIQVTDMCSTWAQYGGYEYVQDRIRYMADAAHSLGMKFTLWVWGAEFNGYGWQDPDVEYYRSTEELAKDNPNAQAAFDKYYSIYAQLADCSDRVIMHFDDPGNLVTDADIAYYAKMMRDKCLAVNPEIDFGVSDYTNDHDIVYISEQIGAPVTFYSGAVTFKDSSWVGFRSTVTGYGFDYGVWSWNLTEMEIDQLAEMNVNARLIKDVYMRTAAEDEYAKPSYWSEMDSYHVLNIFSHYCAGRLLQDPDQDADEVLKDAAQAIAGKEYRDEMYQVLTLIEDARTGDTFESFRWGFEGYILTSDSYDAEDILTRAETALEYIDEMAAADINCNTVTLPVSVTELLEMMRPHVMQIKEFAYFRKGLSELEKSADGGADTGALQAGIDKLYSPIPEYDCIIGLWGQPEAMAQFDLTKEFCKKHGLEIPVDAAFDKNRKDRILAEYVTQQKNAAGKLIMPLGIKQFEGAYGEDEMHRYAQELIDEGILVKEGEDKVYLKDWKSYCINEKEAD